MSPVPVASEKGGSLRGGAPVLRGSWRPPMPWLLLVICSVGGAAAGAVFGFVRGLDYPPTLVVALFEGGVLFGVPATVLGLLLVAAWSFGTFLRRHIPRR